MNIDIRIALSFRNHPKSKLLKRRLGAEGVLSLIHLWMWAAEAHPTGEFTDLSNEALAVAADWDGEPDMFINTLVELGWLDAAGSGYLIHDWDEHNEWAAGVCDRGAKARLSRLSQVNIAAFRECKSRGYIGLTKDEYKTWKDYTPATANAGDKPADSGKNAAPTPATSKCSVSDPLATAGDSLAPSPSPSPSPSPAPVADMHTQKSDESLNDSGACSSSEPVMAPEREAKPTKIEREEAFFSGVAALYNSILVDGQPEGRKLPRMTKFTGKRKSAIRARMKGDEAFRKLGGWEDYFSRVGVCPYLMGEVNDWQAYFDWLLNVNNMLKVQEGQYLERKNGNSTRRANGSTLAERNAAALDAFVKGE